MKIQLFKQFKWIPRIIAVLYICFISLFALDAFSCGTSILKALLGFIIHLIPSLILSIILFISWKKERFGGILFLLLFLAFTFFFNTYRNWAVFLFISVPVFMVGILFVISPMTGTEQREKKINNQESPEKPHE